MMRNFLMLMRSKMKRIVMILKIVRTIMMRKAAAGSQACSISCGSSSPRHSKTPVWSTCHCVKHSSSSSGGEVSDCVRKSSIIVSDHQGKDHEVHRAQVGVQQGVSWIPQLCECWEMTGAERKAPHFPRVAWPTFIQGKC